MLKGFEFFHGVVFARLLHSSDSPVLIRRYVSSGNAAYVLNDCVGLYVKHSGKRLPPWTFSFHKHHQDEMLNMKTALDEVFLILVCNEDGIVALRFDEVKAVLNETHGEVEWVRVSRSKRHMYTVTGSDGDLGFKVAKDDFPSKVFLSLHKQQTVPVE